jgi:hypothetical protein
MMAAALVACLTARRADAGIILGQNDWELGAENWSSLQGHQSTTLLTDPAAGGWLRIDFPFTANPEIAQDGWFDGVRVRAEDLFAGAGTSDMVAHSAPFSNWMDWMFPGATEDQYLADLSSSDWIGVFTYRTGAAEQIYGIDNFRLMVPEPAETVVLCVALAVSLVALRRRAPIAA